ncbi:MAG: hormogonium polysaccharide biosynthesis glycosyltransferase HpsE, partial [Elainella sp.]
MSKPATKATADSVAPTAITLNPIAPNPIAFTVAIPTYNGAQRLPEVLRRLQAQVDLADLSWEVLVVDNNSSDETGSVIQAFQTDFPCPLRYLFEPQQGAGAARQLAIRAAQADLIGFIDDDLWPEPDWVMAAYRFGQQHPQSGAYGSRVSADYEVPPPPKFKRIQAFLAITERGDLPRLYPPSQRLLPPGAGLVIRKTAWLAAVPIQPPSNWLKFKRADGNDCGEDISALTYIHRCGWEVWYNPQMQLRHQIPARRLDRAYLLPLFRSIGLSRVITRLTAVPAWQQPLLLLAYSLSDLVKLLRHW